MTRFVVLAFVLAAARVHADPIRLRADALATTAAPAGLLVLETDARVRAGLSAEAVVWIAGDQTPGENTSGNVLVIAVDARDADERTRARIGRFVSTLGALRATHVDGGLLRVRLPHQLDVEALAGMPVQRGLVETGRGWDWIAGGRIARRLGFSGSAGIAYAQRRDAGQLVTEELGLDAGYAFTRRSDAAARLAYDIANPGIAEIMLSASHRADGVRAELYLVHRQASHLLPASSLFSVLGDVASQRAGTLVTWKAAPRLDVILDLGMRRIDEDAAVDVAARARLRLDPRGASVVGGELRRSGIGDDRWSGARGSARIRLSSQITLSSELELVRPDDGRRGAWWPWGLVAAAWQHGEWQAAVATEASSTAEYRYRVDVLGQVSRMWGGK